MSSRKSNKRTRRRRRRRRFNPAVIASIVLLTVLLVIAAAFAACTVEEISVEGNVHLSSEEVSEYVRNLSFGQNGLAAAILYGDHTPEQGALDFAESLSVKQTSAHSITVHVNEKELTGCFFLDGVYWYFDADGIARASSEEPESYFLENSAVFLTEGLGAAEAKSGMPVQVSDPDVFRILDSIHLFAETCEVRPDKVVIDEAGAFYLVYGKAQAAIGDGTSLMLRLDKLADMLSELSELEGTLHLETYDGSQTRFVFDKSEKVT